MQEGELHIHNSDGQQQATILREDLPGFIFESNRNTKHSFTAETSLGPEFHAGWTGRRGKRFRSKVEAMKQKVLKNSPSLILILIFSGFARIAKFAVGYQVYMLLLT